MRDQRTRCRQSEVEGIAITTEPECRFDGNTIVLSHVGPMLDS